MSPLRSDTRPLLRVDWCTFEGARYAVTRWHYSRSMPAGKSVKVGAWEDGVFIGAVVFSHGANNNIGSPYGLEQTEVCELVRVALTTHRTPTSRIVALAIKMLQKRCPGIRLIVSYADSGEGHHGGIYQAGNWIYVESNEHRCYRIHGELVHARTIASKYGAEGQQIAWLREHVDPNAEWVKTAAKHKYLFPLTPELRASLLPLGKPYPKREVTGAAAPR